MSRLPKDAQNFLIAVTFFAAVSIWLYPLHFQWQMWPEFLLFLVLIAFASMFPIPDPHGGYITAASVLFSVLIVVHGPSPGLLVAGPAYAVGSAVSRRWIPWRTIFNGAQMGISVWLAGLSFILAGGSIARLDIRSAVLPLAIAVLVYHATNNFFISFYFSRVRGTPWWATWIIDARSFILSNLLSIPFALLLAYIYVTIHPLTLLLYLGTLPFQRRANQLQIKQRQVFDQAIDALVIAIDAGFPQGPGHSRRVANTATAVARHLRLSDTQVDVIELGALLHDVGLIGLDESLGQSGQLANQIIGDLKAHVEIGAEISKELPQKGISEIVLYHHEHFDGSGYPRGLAGKEIPIGARVVALAEAFESMRAGGIPYGNPVSASEARDTIVTQSGKSFDPEIVNAFVHALDAGAIVDQEAMPVDPAQAVSEAGGAP